MATIAGMAGATENPGGWRHAAARPFRRAVLRRIGGSLSAAVDGPDRSLGDQHHQELFPRAGHELAPRRPGLVLGRHPRGTCRSRNHSQTAKCQATSPGSSTKGVHPPRRLQDGSPAIGRSPAGHGQGFSRRYVNLTYLQPYLAIPVFLAVFVMLLYFLGKFIALGFGDFSAPHCGTKFFSRARRAGRLFGREAGHRLRVHRARAESDADRGRRVPHKGVWSVGFVTGESFR